MRTCSCSCWRLIALTLCALLASRAHAQSTPPIDIESGTLKECPDGWFVPVEGWKAELTEEKASAGSRSVKLSKSAADSKAAFGNLMRQLPGNAYAGKHVKLTAKVMVVGDGRSQMWFRVDRANQAQGAFDNMGDRPILPGDWSSATIELDVEPDAAMVNVGFMVFGAATVFIDDVKLEVTGAGAPLQEPSPAKPLTPRGLENVTAAAKLLSYIRFFHPSDQAVGVASWDHFAVDLMERAEPATDAADLARRLAEAVAEIAPTVTIWAGSADMAPAAHAAPADKPTALAMWRHHGAGSINPPGRPNVYASEVTRLGVDEPPALSATTRDLAGGVACRIPIAVPADDAGTLPHGKTPDRWAAANASKLPKLTALNRSTRLAGVALAWGTFQHFYPYFDVVETDWNAALPTALAKAADDPDELAYLHTLRELVAKLHDGHGGVNNPSLMARSFLPLAPVWAGKDLVVVGKHASAADKVSIGDVIVAIDGKPIEACYAEVCRRISSATDGWSRYVSARAIMVNLQTADPVHVELRRADGTTYAVDLERSKEPPASAITFKRPESGAEVAPGVVYFDLCGTPVELLNQNMPKLEAAKAIIFDMRGYPNSAAYELMQHLIDTNATSARWCVPQVTRPDHEAFEFAEGGRWPLEPHTPRLKAQIAFLTDGRAISYAESIMGIVEAYKFGEIIGATTAGTNGNVNPFTLPGGYSISWTGMKVLKHDGSRHHGVGIAPTIPVTPTPAGIAADRDEVLEKAVEVMKSKVAAGSEEPQK